VPAGFPNDPGNRAFSDSLARLSHLNKVTAELNRITIKYPNLPKGVMKTFINLDGERGRATLPAYGGTQGILLAKGHEWSNFSRANRRLWELVNFRRWSSERQGQQAEDNWRHELAHNLTTSQVLTDFQAAAATDPATATLAAIRQSVTDYAGDKWTEAIAESFGIYTRAEYAAGDLPAALEAFWRVLLGA
jgi:hypothetical protein